MKFPIFIIFCIVTAATVTSALPQDPPPVWIGVVFAPQGDPAGLRIVSLPYGSPAETAGVRIDDVIVGLDDVAVGDSPAMFDVQLRAAIAGKRSGAEVTLHLIRDGAETPIHIRVIVEDRPAGVGRPKEFSSFDSLEQQFPKVRRSEEELSDALIDQFKIREDYSDLRQRLARLSAQGDAFRMSRVAYIQREPFELRTVAGTTFDNIAAALRNRDHVATLSLAAQWLDVQADNSGARLKTGLNLDAHLDQLVALLADARARREEAFADLTAEDRRYLDENIDRLFDTFARELDLASDPDRARWRRNARILELAGRVDFTKLFTGSALLWNAAERSYLQDLERALRAAWQSAGRPEGVFVSRETPAGKVLAGGHGIHWYTDDAAIILDLDGNDFYTNNAGASRSAIPSALLIDFGGDDAYEATFDWTQGSARLGYGVFIDRAGNDRYVGRAWAQGSAVIGASLFVDEAGDDVYRGDQYVQGAAAWGIAVHIDQTGNDRYDAGQLAQGVALAGSAAWLLNGEGDDNYYSKGKRPTVYGDPGIFDSFSQGAAIGFRRLHSGGVALLYDGAGVDRYEAGNFSQGGGYYYGIGLLRDEGNGNDSYIGSHYNQSFAAHQAIGFLEDTGGADFYTTRHAVAQGTSWDESVTAFIDHNGDDVYEGGASFSHGASAHNGFSVFLDLGGRNRFLYPSPQGSAGPNDYHGGKSFSIFVAAGSRANVYTSGMKSSHIQLNGEHGLFVDVPSTIESTLRAVPGGIWPRQPDCTSSYERPQWVDLYS